MQDSPSLIGPTKEFEDIKKQNQNNVEYWSARQLMIVLGYARWENFEEVVKKAQKACLNSGQIVENHFRGVTKMATVGGNALVGMKDWELDRYACYLIAQNGDPLKPKIALAQTYFAVQSRRQELFDQLNQEGKRVFVRDEVSSQNKKLFSTAKKAGVINFGFFNDAGYRGLYNHSLSEVEKIKGVKKGELLDRAGATELAANLFRITQTEEIINRDKNVYGDVRAANTHLTVGRKVRKTIQEIGGVLPENLPTEKHIRLVRKDLKKLK